MSQVIPHPTSHHRTCIRPAVQLSGAGRGVSDARFDFHLATDSTCPLPGVFYSEKNSVVFSYFLLCSFTTRGYI